MFANQQQEDANRQREVNLLNRKCKKITLVFLILDDIIDFAARTCRFCGKALKR
jgi:hypothetical protein